MSILWSAASDSTVSNASQGNSQANPQLEDSLRGTGAMRADIPAPRQVRSNISAMLVVLKVAMQLNPKPLLYQVSLLPRPSL